MNKDFWYQFWLSNPSRQAIYYAITELGQGGFGSVWSGITNAGVPIAIKMIKPSSDPARDFLNWFNEQDILLKCLNHPHIVACYDQFLCDDGSLVIIMEKAEGSLESFLKLKGSFDASLVCSVGIQLCFALEHIHNLGVIHRDLTLRNILWFSDGRFKVSDFGISKQTVSPDEFARTFIGFKNAIPPELLNFNYSTHQSDIYQLGLVLLTLLIGSDPIPLNASMQETHQMIQDGVPRQIAESLLSKFGKLAEIISIMLRRRDSWRYSSILEVKADLQDEFSRRQALERVQKWLLHRQRHPFLPPNFLNN